MFHLFAGDRYYPGAGLEDYRGVFPTLEGAKAATLRPDPEGVMQFGHDWAEIVVVGHDGRLKAVATRKLKDWRPQEWEAL